MDRLLKLIYKTLYFFGFHQFHSNPAGKKWLYFRRFIFLTVIGLFHITIYWAFFDDNTKFSDKILIASLSLGVHSVDWEYWTIWTQVTTFFELFDWVSNLHKTHKNEIVEKKSRFGYERLASLLDKMMRFDLKFNKL